MSLPRRNTQASRSYSSRGAFDLCPTCARQSAVRRLIQRALQAAQARPALSALRTPPPRMRLRGAPARRARSPPGPGGPGARARGSTCTRPRSAIPLEMELATLRDAPAFPVHRTSPRNFARLPVVHHIHISAAPVAVERGAGRRANYAHSGRPASVGRCAPSSRAPSSLRTPPTVPGRRLSLIDDRSLRRFAGSNTSARGCPARSAPAVMVAVEPALRLLPARRDARLPWTDSGQTAARCPARRSSHSSLCPRWRFSRAHATRPCGRTACSDSLMSVRPVYIGLSLQEQFVYSVSYKYMKCRSTYYSRDGI